MNPLDPTKEYILVRERTAPPCPPNLSPRLLCQTVRYSWSISTAGKAGGEVG